MAAWKRGSGLNYFLSQTDNTAYRDGHKEFRKAVESEKPAALKDFIKDLEKMERDWVVFITSL